MARPLRVEYPGAWYHVMNRGRRRENVFENKADFYTFLKLLGECNKLFELKVHAYALMSNHYHLLISTPLGNLSRIMRHLNGVYTQKVNNSKGYEGALFKGRFKSILVESETYAKALVKYIHLNPYKAGLDEKIGQYEWTSYKAYQNLNKKPDYLYSDEILLLFDRYQNRALKMLNEYTLDNYTQTSELDVLLNNKKWPSILGSDAFKDKIKKMYLGRDLSQVTANDKKAITTTCPKELFANLLCISAESIDTYNAMSKKQAMNINAAFVYIACTQLYMNYTEISPYIKSLSVSTLSRLYSSASKQMNEKKGPVFNLIIKNGKKKT